MINLLFLIRKEGIVERTIHERDFPRGGIASFLSLFLNDLFLCLNYCFSPIDLQRR